MRCCLGPVEKGRIVLYSDLGEVMLKLDTVADQKKKKHQCWMDGKPRVVLTDEVSAFPRVTGSIS